MSTIAELAAQAVPSKGRRTVHEYVHGTLRKAILDGELVGGTRLVQAEIAEALDVSTTPVREALRDLASEGLIKLDPHRGGIVGELEIDELEEIFGLRLILEPEALRRAWPRLTPELIDRVEAIHAEMHLDAEPSEWVEMNSRFHGTVYAEARSPRLIAILESLTTPWVVYVSAAIRQDRHNMARAAVGHEEILAALRARDLDAAVAATAEHLSITRDTLVAALSETG